MQKDNKYLVVKAKRLKQVLEDRLHLLSESNEQETTA